MDMCRTSSGIVLSPIIEKGKLALVIGNSHYEDGANLKSPMYDAIDMSLTLGKLGFCITQGLNLKYDEMNEMMANFVWSIRPSDMVLFYFSGHGCHWENQNYLLPSDNSALSVSNIAECAIKAQYLIDKIIASKPYATIVLLDCCRNYPLRHQSLCRRTSVTYSELEPMDIPSRSLIAMACAPRTTVYDIKGRNSLFTKHLRRHITAAYKDIHLLLRDVIHDVEEESHGIQIPYQNSSLEQRNVFLYDKAAPTTHNVNNMINQFQNINLTSAQRKVRTIYYDNGNKYTGEVNEKGKPDGQGTHWYSNGDRYEGQWKAGKKEGHGIYYYAPGKKQIKYDGEYLNGMRDGYGIEYYSNGSKYEGGWVNNQRKGKCIYTWKSGARYQGDFRHGMANGSGIHYWPNGAKYDGEWKDDKRHGRGIYTYKIDRRYEGNFQNGRSNRRDINHEPNEATHDGEWKDDKRHGYGVYTDENGNVRKGIWRNNQEC